MRLARLDLIRLRVAVPGRPAHDDVRDIDVVALQPHAGEQSVQQLSGLTDERDPLLVLVEARSLADEHQVGARIAGAEHDLRPPLGEPAARARGGLRRVDLERIERLDRQGTHGPRVYEARPTDTIFARQRPRGASTTISSPGFLPSSA